MGTYRATSKSGTVLGYVKADNDVAAGKDFKEFNGGKAAYHIERVSKRSELTGKTIIARNPAPSPFRQVRVGATTQVGNI